MKSELKIPLIRERERGWRNPDHHTSHLTAALPFYRSSFGRLVHRVRSGRLHYWDGVFHHASFSLWCGQVGFYDETRHRASSLFAIAPDRSVYCATCEGRAIGAGLLDNRRINGRAVLFSPRADVEEATATR